MPVRKADRRTTPPPVFSDRRFVPAGGQFEGTLGEAMALWERLTSDLSSDGPLSERWVFCRRCGGWELEMWRDQRKSLRLLPRRGYFDVVLANGDRVEVHNARDVARVEAVAFCADHADTGSH